MIEPLSTYRFHQVVCRVVVPEGTARALDVGLSGALHQWTSELLRGEVENWHRHAVELNRLRIDIRRLDPCHGVQPALDIPVRLGTWAALVAAAISCAALGSGSQGACGALVRLAREVEDAVSHLDLLPSTQSVETGRATLSADIGPLLDALEHVVRPVARRDDASVRRPSPDAQSGEHVFPS